MNHKTNDYRVIGTRPIRHDGLDKVIGRAKYGADVKLQGLLHGKVLRSTEPHARIESIDTTRAQQLPGVRAVITGYDLECLSASPTDSRDQSPEFRYQRENVMATKKTLYKGHPIAAVAAVDVHTAEEAIKLIDVSYVSLPAAVTVLDAIKKDAPILHDDLPTWELGARSTTPSNVANHFRFLRGDPSQGFNKADVVVDREFNTATVHQGYIEPHNATALWDSEGHVTIWCSTQGAFGVRSQVSRLLQIPESSVKVVPMEIGGGFGGKISVYLEPLAAILSQKTGRPVQMQMNRAEVFEATGPTPGTYIKVKIGASSDGIITGAQISLYYEAGAFPGSPVAAGAMCAFGPYNLSNAQVDGYDVVVNKPKTSAYRAPGATTAALAVETVIDEICRSIGMDPIEFRIKNGAQEGDRRIDGPTHPRIGYLETLQTAMAHQHYNTPLEGPNQGRGIAAGFWFNAGGQASCYISVNPDGTISLVEGSTDIGGSRAAIAMQAAEVLGIPAESVNPTVPDTDSIGYTAVTGGSSVAFKTGWAAYEAAQDVKKQMIERAAILWETSPENVEFCQGKFNLKTESNVSLTFTDLAGKLLASGGPVTSHASVDPRGVGPAFAVHIADVEVDPETGKTTVLRYTAVQDVGTAIHPSYVEGQIQGGVVQGIGWALNEEYFYDASGRMANPTFLDYRMPTSLDLPMIDTVIVEIPNPGHPYGVRGVGEVPIVPPPAAIANAIADAVGIRMTVLPMSPEKVLDAFNKKRVQTK